MQRDEQGRDGRRCVRRWTGLAAMAVSLAAAACTEGGRTEYGADGDTGQAAPAASPDNSTAQMQNRDSALGAGGRTGRPGVAGDTLGSRDQAAGRSDSATRAAADSAGRNAGRLPPPPTR